MSVSYKHYLRHPIDLQQTQGRPGLVFPTHPRTKKQKRKKPFSSLCFLSAVQKESNPRGFSTCFVKKQEEKPNYEKKFFASKLFFLLIGSFKPSGGRHSQACFLQWWVEEWSPVLMCASNAQLTFRKHLCLWPFFLICHPLTGLTLLIAAKN